ncbi:MAG: tetratricopeptide repeat protein [Lewinellaceae bacterium]|nr:tetratricopeptide repeat protein [Lewinellaceae bacterium]MCB9290919.1 tetratricopeptide repeat protein [Lewinellaceae bacterium]
MKNLIPHFIQEQYLSGNTHGRFEAYTLFVDLSGFTPLTEALMRQGTRGAEELSNVLNEIFEPLVRMAYAKGGFIPYFAGDAFTAIFPTEGQPMGPIDVIQGAMLARNLFSKRQFRFGNFTIGIKFGLSHGTVEWGIVGGVAKAYYFRGAPIDGCAACQMKARDKDIVIDDALRQHLAKGQFGLIDLEPGFYMIKGGIPSEEASIVPAKLPPIERGVAMQFLPDAVARYNQEGEFRTVISVFISFEGVETHALLNDFASIVLQQINNFSGYFKEIDYGDKGGVLVGFFGAPVSFENNSDRALEFISSIREELRGLQSKSSLRYRVGVTIGTAYTGIVGGVERCQYAAVGNRVNLAARLMTYAAWDEVLVDEEIQKNHHFHFLNRGDIEYKGIKGLVPTFRLVGRNYEAHTSYAGDMVGREEELKQLLDFSRPLFEGESAGIAYIFGEAGIGKSRLVHELKNVLYGQHLVHWHTCQSDQILKKPFNPFIYFLKNYFEQYPESTSLANIQNFEGRFKQLQEELASAVRPEAEPIRRELVRTRTVLAALIGLNFQNSIWDQLDAKGRYQNTLSAIINLLIAESLIHPVVIELEDGHWLDDNSRELLQEFVRHIGRFPIMLVITSRYKDEGTRPEIISEALLREQEKPVLEIDLNNLQPESVRAFAELRLGGAIHDEFFELLLRTSNSNPFYLEQILEYFSESSLLDEEDGKWTIRDKNVKLSSSINAILTARIDRLSTLVKETVKAAAVIGREFEVPILSEVMKTQDEFLRRNGNSAALLKEQIRRAEKGQIWHAMNELRYIFRHSLLREAVYSMQLRARLQQLHRHIGEAIERLYTDNLDERYVDLAFHYEQAGVFDKTCEYLRKAADYARSNYQNQQALDYYEKLLKKLSRQKDVADQIQTHLKKGKVLELIGKWDECEKAYERALKLAKQSRDVLLLGQANNSMGRLLMLKGDYPRAMSILQIAVGLFESIDDKAGIAKAYGNMGNLYFRQGSYDEAKGFFEQSLEIGHSSIEPTSNAQVAANLGLTYMNQGNYDEGIRCQQSQLDICEQHNDKQGMATLYTNMGIVFFEKGDYDAALEAYQKGLALSEELGNKLLTSIAIGCIGSVYERKGDYKRAMENFQRDLAICEELGDKQGIAIALGLIGELLSVEGDFHGAIEYLQKNLMLCEELGYQKGIAKAVNTLGDVFYYTKQYDRSLHFYDRAIDVTRKINNRLVLGASLVEKGVVLIELDRIDGLEPIIEESLQVAGELGNPDLLFDAKILAARYEHEKGNSEQAVQMLHALNAEELSPAQHAAVNYELFLLLPEDARYRQRALELYEGLYRETPRYSYKIRLQQLKEG